jgi:hypothetical protein
VVAAVCAGAVLSLGGVVAPAAAEPEDDWSYNCRGLMCLAAACTAGVGLGHVHYYRFGARVEPSDRDGYDRMITGLSVSELSGRGDAAGQGYSELRISIGHGGNEYAYVRRVQPRELGRVIELPSPVYVKRDYRKYVGLYVNTHLPGDADGGHGQAIGDCAPLIV